MIAMLSRMIEAIEDYASVNAATRNAASVSLGPVSEEAASSTTVPSADSPLEANAQTEH